MNKNDKSMPWRNKYFTYFVLFLIGKNEYKSDNQRKANGETELALLEIRIQRARKESKPGIEQDWLIGGSGQWG